MSKHTPGPCCSVEELAYNVVDLERRLDNATAHRIAMAPGSEAHMAQFAYCDKLEGDLRRARAALAATHKENQAQS